MYENEEIRGNLDNWMKKFGEREGLDDLVTCAKQFIERTIVDAVERIAKNEDRHLGEEDRCPGCGPNNEDEWPTSGQMGQISGLKSVKRMMKKWKTELAMKGWNFYAEFIGLDSDGSSDYYSYQVRWSVPTPAYPEPQVTVSIFFTVEATKMEYRNCPVEVTYIFEGNHFPHRPKMQFRPKWIYDVLDMKTMMFKSFKF